MQQNKNSSYQLRQIIAVGVLLFIEYFIFSAMFDFVDLKKIDSPLCVLGYLGKVAPLGIIIVTALMLLAGKTVRRQITQIAAETPYRKTPLLWITQLVGYIVLVAITPGIYSSTAMLVFWVLCALLTVGSALLLAFPLEFLLPLLRRMWKILTITLATGVVAWIAAIWSPVLWSYLGNLTVRLVASMVTLLPGSVVSDLERAIVGTSHFSVVVSSSCSGYQGIGLMAVFMAAYIFFRREELRFPAVLTLLPLSILLVWFANAFRVFALIAVGTFGHPQIAYGGFHAKAGWVIFCILALAIVGVSRLLPIFTRVNPSPLVKEKTWNPTSIYLLPFLVAIAAAMVTGLLLVNNFDVLYPVRIVAAGVVLWMYRATLFRDNPMVLQWGPVGAGFAVGVLWIALDYLFGGAGSQKAPKEFSDLQHYYKVLWLLFRVFGSCIIIPLIEELAFRGFLQRRLIAKDFIGVSYRTFTWLSFIGTSVAFGLMHGTRWIAGIAAGMVFSWVVYRKGRLVDAVVAHAVSNILIAAYVLLFGKWNLW